MAFRKSVFEELGGFKEWLGPGSIGSNAEDADIIFRTLIAGKKLFYNSEMIMRHDRWVTLCENNIQDLSYVCGEIACYGYFALMGNRFARVVLKENLREMFYSEPVRIFFFLIHLKKYAFLLSFWWIAKMFARLRGAIIVGWFFFFSPRYSTENYHTKLFNFPRDVIYD
ncbi:MAG: hypothetical protein ABI425_06205 [Patescibacteria group bacterium]